MIDYTGPIRHGQTQLYLGILRRDAGERPPAVAQSLPPFSTAMDWSDVNKKQKLLQQCKETYQFSPSPLSVFKLDQIRSHVTRFNHAKPQPGLRQGCQ